MKNQWSVIYSYTLALSAHLCANPSPSSPHILLPIGSKLYVTRRYQNIQTTTRMDCGDGVVEYIRQRLYLSIGAPNLY